MTQITEEMLAENPELVKALKVLQHDKRYNTKLQWFWDNAYPWQREYIALTETHQVTGLIASNQTGKTETVCAVVAAHLTGLYPDWWEGKRFEKPPIIAVAGVDSNHNRMVLQDKLFGTTNRKIDDEVGTGMIPRDLIDMESMINERKGSIDGCHIHHVSGGTSQIIFKSYSQGREAVQGIPLDCVVIDEQPEQEFFSESITRTAARDGLVMCAFTPLKGMTHLVEQFWDLPEQTSDFDVRANDNWAMIRSTWDDINHIDPEVKKALIAGYAPYEVDARTKGIPIAGHGRIYPHTKEKVSYDPENTYINENWAHLIAVDFGFTRDPAAIIKLAWDEANDIIYVTDEWKGFCETDREFANKVFSIDPHLPVAWPRDGSSRGGWKGGDTLAAKLRDRGVQLLRNPFLNPVGSDGRKHNHKHPGFEEINSRFTTNRLKISTECEQLLKEFEQYSYDQNGGTDKNEDHALDAFRYAVMSVIQGFGEPIKGSIADAEWGNEHDNPDFHFQSY